MSRATEMAERIGDLPPGWARVRIGELGMGRTENIEPALEPETEFELWSVPSFPSGEPESVLGEKVGSNKQRVSEGDVLLCKINPRINRVWRVAASQGKPQIASTEWMVFRSAAVEPDFLMWRFREESFREQLLKTVAGVGGSLTRARPQEVAKIEIALPPVAEQRRIVARLEALEARSRRARAALDALPPLLAQARRSLLAAAFRGDLTADWRETNGEADWKETTISDVCVESFYGPRFGESEYRSDGIPTLRTTDFTEAGGIEMRNTPRVLIPKERREKFLLRPGDLLVTRTGSIGKMAIFRGGYDAVPSAYLIRFRFNESVTTDYVFHCLCSPRWQAMLGLSSTAVTQPNVNAEAIKRLPLPLPSQAEQREIVRRLDAAFARLDAAAAAQAAAVAELDRLDASLLARAFRGELVPQDPADEPAAATLQRFRAAREGLLQTGAAL